MTTKTDQLEQRMEKLEKLQNDTLQEIREVKMGLVGSENLQIEGVVQKVIRHDKYIEEDKKRKYRFAGAVSAITFIITMAISLLAIYVSSKGGS